MILYFDAPRADPDRNGTSTLSSAEKRKYKGVTIFYYLGVTEDSKHAYGTTLEDALPALKLVTANDLADSLDQISDLPDAPTYGKNAMIARIAAILRKVTLGFNSDAHLPNGPLPTGPIPTKVTMPAFNNGLVANGATWFGASEGDDKYNGGGWPGITDMQSMISLGLGAMRIPFKFQYCFMPDGTINMWVFNRLVADIKYNMTQGIFTGLDAHEYRLFTDPIIANFWMRFAVALEKAIGGPTSLFGIELMNEPGKSSKDFVKWTEPLRATIKAIRVSGYQGYIFAGAGDWNNMVFLQQALLEVERTGGVEAMDPFNRTIYTGHDYWNKDSNPAKTRNDQGSAVNGEIDIAARYGPTIEVGRRIGAKIIMSEIGGGISPTGPLPAYQGKGKNGRQLQDEYFAFAKANEDVLVGTWFWMGGKAKIGYRHKIEAGNEHTKHLQTFW